MVFHIRYLFEYIYIYIRFKTFILKIDLIMDLGEVFLTRFNMFCRPLSPCARDLLQVNSATHETHARELHTDKLNTIN